MKDLGIEVTRFTDDQVIEEIDKVVETIKEKSSQLTPDP